MWPMCAARHQLSNEITLAKTRRKNAESKLSQNEQKLARLVGERGEYEAQLEDAARLAETQVQRRTWSD